MRGNGCLKFLYPPRRRDPDGNLLIAAMSELECAAKLSMFNNNNLPSNAIVIKNKWNWSTPNAVFTEIIVSSEREEEVQVGDFENNVCFNAFANLCVGVNILLVGKKCVKQISVADNETATNKFFFEFVVSEAAIIIVTGQLQSRRRIAFRATSKIPRVVPYIDFAHRIGRTCRNLLRDKWFCVQRDGWARMFFKKIAQFRRDNALILKSRTGDLADSRATAHATCNEHKREREESANTLKITGKTPRRPLREQTNWGEEVFDDCGHR